MLRFALAAYESSERGGVGVNPRRGFLRSRLDGGGSVAWFLIVAAGLFETGFAVLLKQSHGFSQRGRRSGSPPAR